MFVGKMQAPDKHEEMHMQKMPAFVEIILLIIQISFRIWMEPDSFILTPTPLARSAYTSVLDCVYRSKSLQIGMNYWHFIRTFIVSSHLCCLQNRVQHPS